jgi:hypothetical protein
MKADVGLTYSIKPDCDMSKPEVHNICQFGGDNTQKILRSLQYYSIILLFSFDLFEIKCSYVFIYIYNFLRSPYILYRLSQLVCIINSKLSSLICTQLIKFLTKELADASCISQFEMSSWSIYCSKGVTSLSLSRSLN